MVHVAINGVCTFDTQTRCLRCRSPSYLRIKCGGTVLDDKVELPAWFSRGERACGNPVKTTALDGSPALRVAVAAVGTRVLIQALFFSVDEPDTSTRVGVYCRLFCITRSSNVRK